MKSIKRLKNLLDARPRDRFDIDPHTFSSRWAKLTFISSPKKRESQKNNSGRFQYQKLIRNGIECFFRFCFDFSASTLKFEV